ncbi:deleted in malignant brain tumors 1 protein-like [Carassius auratus]|uniref:Deleted in malignant brain tumors 1 protein-like n=1 Tax=Carassius auratus TaxID=7957 RepID=A0A6P6RB41_CARAU|nr:deleted in malignant brain tumors 1 protein-like [Carassius auratus]
MCDRDVNWFGWYRLFIHGQSAQMPNTCIDEYKCGTHAPLWLNGEHPKVEDGVVTRGVCGHWNNNCCYYNSTPIRVKACPGDYYVYEFVRPFMCAVAYCADVGNINTIYTTITPETNSSEPCGGNMTDWRGVLLSPRYPNNYPNNAQCTWTIHSTGNTTVSLIFTDVDLETCCDYIKVYDGPSTLHPFLGEIQEYRNQSFKSSSNDLTVLFYSDHSVTRRGFHANWVFIESCGGYMTDWMGDLSSPWYPNNYPDNSYCTWTIHSTGNMTVSLTFTDVV